MKFKLRKSAFALRTKGRLNTLLALKEERVCWSFLIPFVTPIFIGFSCVDWISAPGTSLLKWVLIRSCASLVAIFIIITSRARVRYGLRNFLIYAPYYLTIEGIMITQNLTSTPYFAGLVICLFTASLLFSLPPKVSFPVYFFLSLPTFVALFFLAKINLVMSLQGFTMAIGSVIFCTVNGAVVRNEAIQRLIASELLKTTLRNREQEVREKAVALMKRKAFESQFSPQVIADVLKNLERYEKLSSEKISVLVCDIVGSTQKANALDSTSYAEVVEEVFDLISAGCLRWDITIDKFTGDGAQAFAGAPRSYPDDFARASRACFEVQRLLSARKDYLELRWKGPVQLRFGICEGEALVGFLGKGAMKSFTAIGPNVSLAHRLCSEAKPNTILVYSLLNTTGFIDDLPGDVFAKRSREVSRIKGFEDLVFKTVELLPRNLDKEVLNLGRCPICSTPLVLLENMAGIPKLVCPSCSLAENELKIQDRKGGKS